MPQLNHNQLIAQFQEFRQKLYNFFGTRRDSIMDLLDALAGNKEANSIAELSLNSLFRRSYSALYKAIEESFETSIPVSEDTKDTEKPQKKDLLDCISQLVSQPEQRTFYLFAIDTTPHKRPYARTLTERGYIYQPNTIKGNKPINIGHSYSIVSMLPEKDKNSNAAWSIPLSGERVPISSTDVSIGSEQINNIMSDTSLPWSGELCVLAADSIYSQRSFLAQQALHKNLVVIARTRSNRVFYQSPCVPQTQKRRGCPKKYGERFNLADEKTWHEADETTQTNTTTRSDRHLTVTIQAWHQMLMRGTKHEPMYRHPFTLVRIVVTDDTNESVWKPMWLIVIGEHRSQISSLQVYQSYRQRFDIEHMFRFCKQRLLMAEFQTPEVKHEENWVRLTLLSYAQLWAAKELAAHLPRPWERYLQQNSDKIVTPSVVQRDFPRIILEIGTPANSPKLRGKSSGRKQGQLQQKRIKHPVVKKQSKSAPKTSTAA